MANNEYYVSSQENSQPAIMNQAVNIPTGDINQGTVLVESQRAVAEAQGKLIIAQRFPRDPLKAYAKVMEACQRLSLASKAFYQYSRGSSSV